MLGVVGWFAGWCWYYGLLLWIVVLGWLVVLADLVVGFVGCITWMVNSVG